MLIRFRPVFTQGSCVRTWATEQNDKLKNRKGTHNYLFGQHMTIFPSLRSGGYHLVCYLSSVGKLNEGK